nr:hypothetical protein MACL_00000172 [Theileria orientalis]
MISFVRDKDTINCDVDKLRRDRWNWAAYITDYSLGTDLKKPLEDAFKKTFWNRTIEFEQGKFVNSCETVSFKRKNKNCSWWVEETFNYKNFKDLPGQLDTISKEAKEEVNAVIIEKTSRYHGVSEFKQDKQPAYMKYTHEFGTANTTVLLSNRTKLDVGPFKNLGIKAKHVEVCYLKVGDNNDTQPFLIALYENESKLAKVCHFNNKDKFDDWIELEPMDKLEEKLKKISESGSCSTHVFWLRKVAFYFLTTGEPPPEAPPKEPVPPERPPVDSPTPPPPPGRNWWLIIGCSVGGFLLLVALVVGYGIYWYNTTIKLLT